MSKQTEILDTFFVHTSPVVTRRVLMRAIRRGARKAYERATGLDEAEGASVIVASGRPRTSNRTGSVRLNLVTISGLLSVRHRII